jgi:hypothetical protein
MEALRDLHDMYFPKRKFWASRAAVFQGRCSPRLDGGSSALWAPVQAQYEHESVNVAYYGRMATYCGVTDWYEDYYVGYDGQTILVRQWR